MLRELEEQRREAASSAPPGAIDMFGQPEDAPSPPSMGSLVPLMNAWERFETAVLQRLDTWELRLWPLVSRWNRGEDVSREIRVLVSELSTNAERLTELLELVRTEASFIGETRATMLVVYRAVDTARKAEEQLVPALRAGAREAADRMADTATPQLQSSADITNSLRARRLADPDEETEEIERDSGGFVRQLFGWLNRK